MRDRIQQERDEVNYFTRENRQLAEIEVLTWCKSTTPSIAVVKLVAKLWTESANGLFPTLNELVSHFQSHSCICVREYPFNDQQNIIRHFLVTYGRLPACIETKACMEYYYLNHNTFPTNEDLITTISRMIEISNSPLDFYEKDKKHIPTPNLSALQSNINTENEEIICALCQEHVNKGQGCYRLKPCNHVFHSDSKDCLGTCNILEWLSKHRTCAVCRTEVVVDKIPKKKD